VNYVAVESLKLKLSWVESFMQIFPFVFITYSEKFQEFRWVNILRLCIFHVRTYIITTTIRHSQSYDHWSSFFLCCFCFPSISLILYFAESEKKWKTLFLSSILVTFYAMDLVTTHAIYVSLLFGLMTFACGLKIFQQKKLERWMKCG
jgi:hypothetical protein